MRDDRNKWPLALGQERPNLIGADVTAQVIRIERQTVISGMISNCLSICGVEKATEGGQDIATGEAYALRQRRDRILVVNGPALDDGWHADEQVAVSDMSAAYAVVSLSGSNAERVIATGTEFDSRLPSPSVSRLWHGFGMLLYQHGSADAYRIHIRSAHLEALWEMLERQFTALSGLSTKQTRYSALDMEGNSAKLPSRKAS